MKFCKDCFHFKNDNCYHEKNLEINLITGDLKPINFPFYLRNPAFFFEHYFKNICGKKAKWFKSAGDQL